MRIPLEAIRENVLRRPDCYYDDVIAQGKIVGDELELSQEAFGALVAKYESMPVPIVPLREKLANFAAATAKWRRHGFPVVTREELRSRAERCEACDYWRRDDLIPTCAICGCPELKHELATEECPLPEPIKKWRVHVA